MGQFDEIKYLRCINSFRWSFDVWYSMLSLAIVLYIYQLKNQCSTSHCSAGNGKLRVHDSGSPTTEQNLENVFQLIHRINFIFGNTHDAHTDDDIQH